MKFWQSLAFCEPAQCAEVARRAEELGFEGVTLAEHQFFPEQLESAFPFAPDGIPPFDAEDAWPDFWPLIGAMATTTHRLRFATAVHVLPLQPPLTVARQAATAEALAPGRLALGVGAGWMREEYDAFGVDFRSRGARMDECIEILRASWTGAMFEYRGRFFDFDRLSVRPAPSVSIPIWVGSTSEPALRRAARTADGWLGGGGPVADTIATLERLRELRRAAGREQLPFETLSLHLVGTDLGEARRLGDAGLGGIVNPPFRMALGRRSSLPEKFDHLERFAERVIHRWK